MGKLFGNGYLKYLLVLFLTLMFFSSSPSFSIPSSEPNPTSTIEDNHEGRETQSEPTVASISPPESDQQIDLFSSENTLSVDLEIHSIPPGEYLVYFDWISDGLYLLNGNGAGHDQRVANHWGVFSEDAEHFAYIYENTTLVVIELEGMSITQVPLDLRCYNPPSWSVSGDRLAIECEDNIYIYSLIDSSFIRLTSWGQRSVDAFLSPIWSPDGSRIAYSYRQLSSLAPAPENGIYITEAGCLSEPELCQEKTDGPILPYSLTVIFAWSPDSSKLAISEDLRSIRIVEISTYKESIVIDNLDYIDGLAWSLDGDWVAYSINGNIYKVSSGGGEPVLLAEDKGYVATWIMKIAE